MKAVLVIEMPTKCEECPLHYRKRQEIYRCEVNHKNVNLTKKPSWCPLRPLPPKHTSLIENSYAEGRRDGWNACLDEILGETE